MPVHPALVGRVDGLMLQASDNTDECYCDSSLDHRSASRWTWRNAEKATAKTCGSKARYAHFTLTVSDVAPHEEINADRGDAGGVCLRAMSQLVFQSRHGAIHCIQSQCAPRPRWRQNGDRGAGRSRHTTFVILGLGGLAPVHRL